MKQTNFKLYSSFIFLFLIIFGVIIYYFLFFSKKDTQTKNDISIFLSLKEDPEYLIRENLVKIKDEYLFEYFRQRLIYHNYSSDKKSLNGLTSEIESEFPGEKGRVLIELLNEYNKFENSKKEVMASTNLDSFEKIEKINMIKIETFGEKLSEILFPSKDSERITKFYNYADRYLKKHLTDLPKSKRNHLEKARMEIYGEDFDKLFPLETAKKRLGLEIQINERELSILNEDEKKIAIEDLKVKMREFAK